MALRKEKHVASAYELDYGSRSAVAPLSSRWAPSFSLLFARRCHAWAPDHAREQGCARRSPPPPSPPIRVITSRPLNIRILSPLCVQSPSGICRPSSRFASSAGFWLAPWFIGPRNSYDGRNPREIEVRLGIGESFKRRAALETRRKAMSPLSELLHNVLLSAPRWGGSKATRRGIVRLTDSLRRRLLKSESVATQILSVRPSSIRRLSDVR